MLSVMNLLFALVAAAGLARAEHAVLEDVSVTAKNVTLRFSRPVGFRASTTVKPPAIVLTFDETRISDWVKEKSVASALVAGISALPVTTAEGEKARVIIKLAKARDFNPTWDGNTMKLELTEPKGGAPAAPPSKGPAAATPSPEKVPATKPAKPAAKGDPKYWVQVGSFPDEATAVDLKKKVEGKAGPVEIRKVDVGGKPMFKVLVGPAQPRPAAQKQLGILKGFGHPGFLYKE